MARQQRPGTVVMVAFATGSITVNCPKTKPEVIAIMNVPDMELTGSEPFLERPTRVQIPSLSETDIHEKNDPRSRELGELLYRLVNETIEFRRKDVVFWSVAEAIDPPLVQPVHGMLR